MYKSVEHMFLNIYFKKILSKFSSILIMHYDECKMFYIMINNRDKVLMLVYPKKMNLCNVFSDYLGG